MHGGHFFGIINTFNIYFAIKMFCTFLRPVSCPVQASVMVPANSFIWVYFMNNPLEKQSI